MTRPLFIVTFFASMLSLSTFDAMARDIARLNNLPFDVAADYASRIRDTIELSEDGRAVVRNDEGQELARIILPSES